MAEMEDRSRRNNLRFDGLLEENGETWERSEEKVLETIKEHLNIDNEIKIERAHRSGYMFRRDNSRNEKRTIVVKLLNYKDKQTILQAFREKQLWKSNIYINEDFSKKTMEKRKILLKEVKELKVRGVEAKR